LRSKNSKYSKYVTGFDETTGVIQIDWEEFNKIKDSDKGSEVDEYLSKLEGLRDQWQEAQDKLEEIEDSVDEIRQQGEDEYFDLEDRLKEALVNERQKEIDKLSEINDSINDSNSKILESMQEQIDEYRQTRDNQKTEEELSDKQRRLAYLQQDTSGANAMEILNL
jgi:chromosome segregation ATPase